MENLPLHFRKELLFQASIFYFDEHKRTRDIKQLHQDMKNLVNQMLDAGIYLDDFLDIVDVNFITNESFLVSLQKILTHFGIIILSKQQAAWIVVAYYAQKIIDNSHNVFTIMHPLIDILLDPEFEYTEKDELGYRWNNSYDTASFYALYYATDDINGIYKTSKGTAQKDIYKSYLSCSLGIDTNGKSYDDAIRDLEIDIVEAAKRWLLKHHCEIPLM